MDILLGGIAFAVMIFAQFAAVVAVDHGRKSRESETFAAPDSDHRARLIWHSGS